MPKRKLGPANSDDAEAGEAMKAARIMLQRMISKHIQPRRWVVLAPSNAIEDGLENTLAKALDIDIGLLVRLLITARLATEQGGDDKGNRSIKLSEPEWSSFICDYNEKYPKGKLKWQPFRAPKGHGIKNVAQERPRLKFLIRGKPLLEEAAGQMPRLHLTGSQEESTSWQPYARTGPTQTSAKSEL